MSVRFHDALRHAVTFLSSHPTLGSQRLLVRDLRGCIRIFLADRPSTTPVPTKWAEGLTRPTKDLCAQLAPGLHGQLGPWSVGPETVLQDACVFADFPAIWDHPDAYELNPSTKVLERGVIGADWLRKPLPNRGRKPPRATLFGLKGGVGRSSALAVWARHLAEVRGLKVLVVDLDLEAPGVGSLLLPDAQLPDYGVVDWFVERAVGQHGDLLREISSPSPLVAGTRGEIRVVPAAGRETGLYLPKLARVYQGDHRNGTDVGFGDLLAEFIDDLEEHLQPQVVLLDSRAGLHDVAAIALTRLEAHCFLFAVDTPQTWKGYEHLFAPWVAWARRDIAAVDPLRRKLQLVAGQVPERDQDRYFERMRAHAYALFSQLYDEDPASGQPAPSNHFAFSADEDSAPHDPIPVYWSSVMTDWDPVNRPSAVTPAQLNAAFGPFLERATELLGFVP